MSQDPLVQAIAQAITDTAQPINEAFTRQHYVAIAKIIKDSNSWGGHGDEAAAQREAVKKTLKLVAAELVDLFREDNPSFDRARFYSACGF
jgi:hypothetical protein